MSLLLSFSIVLYSFLLVDIGNVLVHANYCVQFTVTLPVRSINDNLLIFKKTLAI